MGSFSELSAALRRCHSVGLGGHSICDNRTVALRVIYLLYKNRSGISVDRLQIIFTIWAIFTLASLAYSLILLSKGIDTKNQW